MDLEVDIVKNKKINVQKAIKMTYKENKRSSLVIYLVLRFLVIYV